MSDLPTGWASATVGEIATLTDGPFGSNLKTSHYVDSGPRVVRLQNIGDGVFRDERAHITLEHFQRLAKHQVVAGDVVAASLGDDPPRACLVPSWLGPAIVKADCIRMRPGPGIDPGFLMWMLNSRPVRAQGALRVKGIGRPRLGLGGIRQLVVPVPPLNEQRRIVAAIEEHLSRLDAADASLATVSRRLAGLIAAVYATATDGDWPVSALADLAERITKGTTPTSLGHSFTQDGVLFVKAESLVGGVIDHARCAHIDQPTHDLLERSQLAADDVLVTIAGTLGRVGVVRATDLPANTNQAVSLTRLREPELAPWVATWLNSPGAKRHLAAGGRGVGLQNLNLKQIGEVPVPVPPLEEQRRIVAEIDARLSAIDALRAAIERAQRRGAALRRSVLERAFRGELVPQDPFDEPASALLARIRAERVSGSSARSRRATRAPK